MKKAPEAFRTISEVADLLDTPAHVLRFWESKFYQIRPVKRAGGRRYYRPDDVALINGIKTLLQDRGMTIRGAQRILQEQGVKVVAQMGLPLPHGGAMLRVVGGTDETLDLLADLPEDDALAQGPDGLEGAGAQPQDELTMEMQPSPRYAEPEAEGEETPVSDPAQAAGQQPEGDGAITAAGQVPVEEVAMSSDDLLTPLSDPPVEGDSPAPDLLSALLRPKAPVAAPEAPVTPDPVEISESARLAKALRALPRTGQGLRRDRMAMLARRIDTLLDRMSEASGAGRW